jgi:Zn-dependent protease with chaperone function
MTHGSAPGSHRVVLPDIAPVAFQHPLDRQATEQLKKIPGFDSVVKKCLEYGFERVEHVVNTASNIRVGPNQLPWIYQMLRECCQVLDVDEPGLYIADGPPNAITAGHTKSWVVLYTGLLDVMSRDEIMAVIAHELGHIKCGHVLYRQMASWIGQIGTVIGHMTLGIGGVMVTPIEAGLTLWARRSELSADRAALLVMQDPTPCMSALMKLAGGSVRLAAELDLDAFLEQARQYRDDIDRSQSDRFYRLVASLHKGDHPFGVERARELLDWIETDEPHRILSGDYARLREDPPDGRCSVCGIRVLTRSRVCGFCERRGSAP